MVYICGKQINPLGTSIKILLGFLMERHVMYLSFWVSRHFYFYFFKKKKGELGWAKKKITSTRNVFNPKKKLKALLRVFPMEKPNFYAK
jgi:hypothetical protein